MRRGIAIVGLLLALIVRGDELEIARSALREGLWEIARTHAEKVENLELARLVILESYAGENDWDKIRDRLKQWPDSKGPGFDYYRLIVDGKRADAIKLLKNSGDDSGIIEAKLFEAEALAEVGSREAAKKVWGEIAAASNVSTRAYALAAINLMDADKLRKAYGEVKSTPLRRHVGLRLGMALLQTKDGVREGEKLIRAIVKDAPDTTEAMTAMLAVADKMLTDSSWTEAIGVYSEIASIWPDALKNGRFHEGRGWALLKTGKREEALASFKLAEEYFKDEIGKAMAMVKQGDALLELNRREESINCYHQALLKYPKTSVAEQLRKLIHIRELEAEGRELYKKHDFAEAEKRFAEVRKADPSRSSQMAFFEVLCKYGSGRDDEAAKSAAELTAKCPEPMIKAASVLWLAKFRYNRSEWKAARALFEEHAKLVAGDSASAANSIVWAARAAMAENDLSLAIRLTSKVIEHYAATPAKTAAIKVQSDALMESARFDEAILVFDMVLANRELSEDDRLFFLQRKADALFATGADNPARYEAALTMYQSVRDMKTLAEDDKMMISYKIAQSLKKLNRRDEAMDEAYANVVLKYRDARAAGKVFSDAAMAVFSRAAFGLVDEYESRGQELQAMSVLELIVSSDVPAAEEARRQIGRILNRGRFLQ